MDVGGFPSLGTGNFQSSLRRPMVDTLHGGSLWFPVNSQFPLFKIVFSRVPADLTKNLGTKSDTKANKQKSKQFVGKADN